MEPGARLDGYELVRLLGAGGMGEVWLATDLRLGRKVAIKLLPAALTSDPGRVARFEHEARAASSLNHPNVCTIHTLGHADDGQRYIAMELVEGQSLRERLSHGTLPRPELLAIATQIAAALTASHAAGVVHRDLKPENVMLRPDGLVKVVDFGLAKLTDAGAGSASTTQLLAHTVAGAIVGTVMYMSPEQARGLPVDARTDVWSLGVMLFEMLEGRPPFNGETATDILAAILASEPVLRESGSGASQELRRIIGKALRKDREQRYQVMKDLELDLQALRDERELPIPADTGRRAGAARSRTPLMIAAAAIVAVVAGLTWWRVVQHAPAAAPPSGASHAPVDRPLTRLTFDPGLQTDPAFSPDGRSIAYASDRNGNFDIWVQPVDGGQARQITTSSAQDTQPTWSPDGRTIVYRSEGTEGGLFTAPAEGGPARRLTSFGQHPQWISDREILFVDGRYGTEHSRLLAVSPDGMDAPHPLVQDALNRAHWNWIAPHPDGRISMLGWEETGAPLFVTASRDGTRVTTSAISRSLQFSEMHRFSWSPTGDALYLEAFDKGVNRLWKVYVEPRSLNWREAEPLTGATDDSVALAISRDGSRIAYSSQRTATQLWTFPLQGDPMLPRLGRGKAMSPGEGRVANVTLSPDGKFVAYLMNRPGAKHSDLTLADLTTGRTEVLAVHGWSPAWSRDSRQLAYLVTREGQQGEEFAMVTRELGAAERMLKRWSDESLFMPSAWFEGGEVLGSFVKGPFYGRSVLATWATPGDVPARVLLDDENASFWQGAISPNGRWIAFTVAPKRGSPFVGIAPATGSPAAKFVEPFGHEIPVDKPKWSADGRTLFVLAKNGQPFLNVWSMRFDPDKGTPVGGLTQVSRFDSPGFGVSTNQDENDIGIAAHVAALPMTTASGGIWMMENADK
jgi:Tol biopolymer transport system component